MNKRFEKTSRRGAKDAKLLFDIFVLISKFYYKKIYLV